MSDVIQGTWVALPTPLSAEGTVDHGRLLDHALGMIAHGMDGIVPFGTTGEGTSFSAAERLSAVESLLRGGIAASRIGLGAGFPALPDTIALTRGALAIGLTHILLLPPYFYRDAPPDGIEDAFARIIDTVQDDRLRVTLYHIPQVSGVAVPAAVAASLRGRYGRIVAGVKDSSGDFNHFRAFRAAAPDLAIAVGNEADIARALAEGGAGTICGLANITPALVRAMTTRADADAEAAMRAAIALFAGRPFVPTLKAILAAQTGDDAWLRVRPPLRPATASEGQRLALTLNTLQPQDSA
jgi:4-hydroxy-tetrahydrodipicolinate synthase